MTTSELLTIHPECARRERISTVARYSAKGKVSEEWVGEASVLGFGILPRPSERLCTQKTGRSIACRRGRVYIVGREVKTEIPAKGTAS